MISFRQLRYFDALARHAHFGRAAEACAVSQPALSVQIKDLEDSLGTPLIERGSRQIQLTAAGTALLPRVRAILLSVEELEDLARTFADTLTGRLRIGVIPTVAPYILPAVIRALARDFPALDIRPHEAITPKLIERVAEGKLDAAIVALPVSEPAFVERGLFDEEFVLVRPIGAAGRPVPDLSDLKEMRLLLLEEGHCFREQALSFCHISATASQDLMEGSSLSTLVQMVGAGIGVTLIPEMAVAVESRAADVEILRMKAPRPSRTIGMIWRRTNPLAAQLSEIGDLIRDVAFDLLHPEARTG